MALVKFTRANNDETVYVNPTKVMRLLEKGDNTSVTFGREVYVIVEGDIDEVAMKLNDATPRG